MSEQRVDMYSFVVSLCSAAGDLKTLWLPEIPDGVYYISDEPEYRFLRIEGQNGEWVARCIQPAFFQKVSIQNYTQIRLTDEQYLSIDCDGRGYSLFTQKVSSGITTFRNYIVPSNAEISIGNKSSNDIYYENKYVSKRHALLMRTGRQWQIQDLGSDSGVFVNGQRVNSAPLQLGDVLFIMGMRIIIGTDFISINNGDDRIGINHRLLKDATLVSASGYSRYSGDGLGEVPDSYFNRAPRKRMELEAKTIEVEGPPMSMEKAQMPLMLRMGGSMVMGGTAALAGNYTMLLSSVLFPLLSSKFTDKQRQEYEQLRKTKYTEYLEARRKDIEDACTAELQLLNKKYPNLSAVADQMRQKQRLWERRPGDDDFLQLRLGSGNRPLSAVISYPEKRFGLDEDPLEEQMYQLAEKQYGLKDAPILISLVETTVCGLKGNREQVIDYVLQLVMQTAVFHSYDEVKMVFLLNQEELGRFDCVRYLPHVWDDLRSVRFIATNESESYKIGDYLKGQIQNKETERELNEILRKRPYYLVFALDKKVLDGHEFFKETLQSNRNNGISIVVAGDELPKETQVIITLAGEQKNICTALGTNGGEDTYFAKDYCNSQQIDTTMRMLANTSLKTVSQAQEMPKMITFLEMYQCGRIEQLNPLQRWRENNPVNSLAAPVGVGADGSLFVLDVHEKRQGPHGLVAGMTGSGKSEFIITYILSMAVNYHPDEVAFVLIDYKGGGLASAFENPKTGMRLPHLMGTITNLDGASIQRSLMSIESELIRRQKVFSEVASTTNEGTMDIYAYQKLYRAGRVSEPMPHLFIVSDEFAELKQQQPEFMEKLISAARIGRSLGVHLILATQKPSGVVNDQIRSNTKFRVCLRVQDRSDSMDMLKRADAAELTDTGRFYLQVGYNEYFALGQSAWCGAAYEPQDKVIVQRDDAIEFLNTTGEVVVKAKPKVKKTDSGVKQIVAIVQHLSDLAKREHIEQKQLWIDVLPAQFSLDYIRKSYGEKNSNHIQALLGIVDAPMQQRQFPLYLDIQHNCNLLIAGESGSGKTTMLQTLLYELVTHYSSRELQYYILDFSSRTLNLFEKLPHCGGILTDEDENAIMKMLRLIKELIVERRKLFATAEVSNFDSYLEIEDLPIILLIIDNVVQIDDMQARSDIYSMLEDFMSNGVSYGIKVVFTLSQINTCPMRLRRNAGTKIALRARDRYVYSDILDHRCLYEPDDYPGRGMCVISDSCYEFQTAVALDADRDKDRTNAIRQELSIVSSRAENTLTARRLEILNKELMYEEFCSYFQSERIPLGFHLDSMRKIAIPLQQLKSISLYFGNRICVVPVLKNLFYSFNRENADILLIKRLENSVFDAAKPIEGFAVTNVFPCAHDSVTKIISILKKSVTERKVYRDSYCSKNDILDWNAPNAVCQWRRYIRSVTKPVFVVFESLIDVSTKIDIQTAGVLGSFFQACYGYNIYFVACMYPDDDRRLHLARYPNGEDNMSKDESSKEYRRCKEIRHIWDGIKQTFNAEKFACLFGGRFDMQRIVSLPAQWQNIKKPYNAADIDKFLLQYQGTTYSMSMPCDKENNPILDVDEESIL